MKSLLALSVALLLSSASACVVVTGATGYVAGHVIDVLLARGNTVRGTVRDPSDEKKVAHLLALAAKHKAVGGKLTLHAANLMDADPFSELSKGCDGMIHIASPVTFSKLEDPYESVVRPAIQGTLSAARAAKSAGMKVLVATSSVASISPSKAKIAAANWEDVAPYTEDDWNDVAELDFGTYSFSKTEAEKALNKFMETEKPGFRLATIHFPMAIGPQQTTRVTSSNQVIKHLLRGEFFLTLPSCLDVVDVRDVGKAHVDVYEGGSKATGRFIVHPPGPGHGKTFLEVADALRSYLPDYPIAQVAMPWPLFLLVPIVDGRIDDYTVQRAKMCPGPGYDGSRIVKEIGFTYDHTDSDATIRDCARSMIDLGIVDGKRHLLAFAYVVMALPVVALLVLAGMLRCLGCCGSSSSSSSSSKTKQA